jgi:hypothetical protein
MKTCVVLSRTGVKLAFLIDADFKESKNGDAFYRLPTCESQDRKTRMSEAFTASMDAF